MSPAKPTRDDATASRRMGETPGGAQRAAERSEVPGKDREERGSAADNGRNPPHVTPNAEDAPLQEHQGRPGDVAIKGANAQGRDKIPADEHQPIMNDESMYDGRPEEDKDRPPSSPASP